MSDWVVAMLGLPGGSHLLDVGCAEGVNAVACRESGLRVTAVEIDGALVASFRPAAAATGVSLIQADAAFIPLANHSVDAVMLIEVFEHVASPSSVLSEVHRVLRPHGILLLAVPTDYTEHVYAWLHPRYRSNAGHLHTYSRVELAFLLDSAGFAIMTEQAHNLAPAISWLLHALLRSNSDQTGRVLQHHWADRVSYGGVALWSRTPLARRGLRWLEMRAGKSRYLRCLSRAS